MKTFVNTGFHLPTMTTADDPSLSVLEVEDGESWYLKFYVNNKLIDTIDMMAPHGDLDSCVARLPVFGKNNRYKGKVRERFMMAREMREMELKQAYLENDQESEQT